LNEAGASSNDLHSWKHLGHSFDPGADATLKARFPYQGPLNASQDCGCGTFRRGLQVDAATLNLTHFSRIGRHRHAVVRINRMKRLALRWLDCDASIVNGCEVGNIQVIACGVGDRS
jgi:hypothetical protein